MRHELSETTKHAVDALSVATVLGTIIEMLPAIAAAFTIVWTGIRIYETNTVQNMLGRRRRRKSDSSAEQE